MAIEHKRSAFSSPDFVENRSHSRSYGEVFGRIGVEKANPGDVAVCSYRLLGSVEGPRQGIVG